MTILLIITVALAIFTVFMFGYILGNRDRVEPKPSVGRLMEGERPRPIQPNVKPTGHMGHPSLGGYEGYEDYLATQATRE